MNWRIFDETLGLIFVIIMISLLIWVIIRLIKVDNMSKEEREIFDKVRK